MGASNDKKRVRAYYLPGGCSLWHVTDCSGRELSIIEDRKGYELDVIGRNAEKQMVAEFLRRLNARYL